MQSPDAPLSRILALTSLAMLAFAANSLLCRAALGDGLIDAASFTAVRVLSGAVLLALILRMRGRMAALGKADWRSTAMLFTYMACFSFAYLSLGAGTGALILFGAVQLTMFGAALAKGERFSLLSWTGLGLAVAGLAWLVFPGVSAPDPLGAVLMAAAGAAWGPIRSAAAAPPTPSRRPPTASSSACRRCCWSAWFPPATSPRRSRGLPWPSPRALSRRAAAMSSGTRRCAA